MTRKEQRRIVSGMLAGMRKTMERSLKEVPESWDGIELRQLLADTAALYADRHLWRTRNARRRSYRGVCALRCLPRSA
jgi:hypothetical protein